MVKLSIIIPYKDTPETLFELLATIPENSKYEIILVDDNSKNPICATEWPKKNLTIYSNDSSSCGAGAARNIGISKAHGKWLFFADADDWFTKDAFTIFESYVDSESDIIYFKPDSKHHNSNLAATRHQDYADLVYEFINYNSDWIRYRFHSPWSKMIKRSLFARHGIRFDETRVANDIICSLRLGLFAKQIEASEKTVYVVRQGRPDSLSLMRDEDLFDIRLNNHFRYNLILSRSHLAKRAMGGLPTLRKGLSFGWIKFFNVLLLFIKEKQPIFERPSYYKLLTKRNLRRIF